MLGTLRRRSQRRIFRALFLTGALFVIGLAQAHPQFALSTVNRYATLALTGSFGARIFYTFMVGDVPAHTLRRQADLNGDGTLDASEQQALGRQLISQMADLSVQLDGKPVALTFAGPPLSLSDPRVSPLAFAFELTAQLPIPNDKREHLVRVEDRINLAPVGDVELRIEEGPGVRMLSTWEGAAPAPPAAVPADKAKPMQLLFQALGPPRSSLSDRSVSVRFVEKGAPQKSRFGCSSGRF